MYELNQHKRKDSIKWTITFIAIVLLAIMVVGLCLQLFVTDDKYKPSEWFKKPEQEEQTKDNALVSVVGCQQMLMASAKIAEADYEEYGVSPQADSAYILTAILESDVMEDLNTNGRWSAYWNNASSAWASGKTVSDYVTVTKSTSNSLQATITCLQGFGEPVTVKFVPEDNDTVSATAQVDYVKRFKKITPPSIDNTYAQLAESSSGLGTCAFDCVAEFDVGTIQGDIYIDKIVLTPNDTMKTIFSNAKLTEGCSSMGFNGSASLKSYTVTRNAKISLQPDNSLSLRFKVLTTDFLQINGGGNTVPVIRNLNNLFVDYNKSPVAYFGVVFTFSLHYEDETIQTVTTTNANYRFDSQFITKVARVTGVSFDNTSLVF